MTKDLIIVVLGVWVALVPFLGFPSQWDTIIFVVSGLLIVVLMLMLRRDFVRYITHMKVRHSGHRGDSFVESGASPPAKSSETKRVNVTNKESSSDEK